MQNSGIKVNALAQCNYGGVAYQALISVDGSNWIVVGYSDTQEDAKRIAEEQLRAVIGELQEQVSQ